jgi:hypothetical protein
VDAATGTPIFKDNDNKKIMNDALDFYEKDLELSKNSTIKKLGGNFSKFDLVDNEIDACGIFKDKLSRLPVKEK